MADENAKTDTGTNEGDPGTVEGDKTAGNKAAVDDQNTGTDKTIDAEGAQGEPKSGDANDKDGLKFKQSDTPLEKYEEFKIPEGFTLNDVALNKFSPVALELGLSQENAQKMIDVYSEIVGKRDSEIQESFAKEDQDNIAAVKADPEFGGANYESNLSNLNRCLSKFGSKEAAEILNQTGVFHNPDVKKFFFRWSKAMGEDSLVDKVSGGGVAPADTAPNWYPKME